MQALRGVLTLERLWIGLAGRPVRLPREAILETGVTELVYRPDDAQHVALAGIFQEPHEPGGVWQRTASCKKASDACQVRSAEEHEHDPGGEPGPESGSEPGPEPDLGSDGATESLRMRARTRYRGPARPRARPPARMPGRYATNWPGRRNWRHPPQGQRT